MWESLRECEGVNTHTPKATPNLGNRIRVDFRNFREQFQGSKLVGFLYIIGKLLERRYLKWAHIAHLDIWCTSYGQKKGRESNCQFDSRPLKVGNRLLPEIRFESATWRWKDLNEGYNFGSDLLRLDSAVGSYELPKSRDLNRDNFRTPIRESQEKVPFGCSLRRELQSIL
jgi:hypothetical protein